MFVSWSAEDPFMDLRLNYWKIQIRSKNLIYATFGGSRID